ncbi:MAG TPA: ribose-phosphate diphosphokinase [Nitrososphaeraceae archaeon]|nr:ribose-phosphate diphosphokinase [Nitrososphaeraceae archaeon]
MEKNNTVIISDNRNSSLAKNISLDLEVPYKNTELRTFADGESKIRLDNMAKRNCIIIHSTYPPIDQHLMQLFMIIHKCKQDGASDICVVNPYLAYARQDKVFVDGEIVTINLIGRILASLGTTKLITIDTHSPESLNYSFETVDLSAIPSLASYVKKNFTLNKPIVISPDEGGIERAKKFARVIDLDMLSLVKTRDRYTGDVSITLSEQLPLENRDALIVDDMISTGSSIIKATEILKKNKIGDVYVACTHALLLDDAKEKLFKAGIKEIISTNSIPNEFAKVDLSSIISNYFSVH